MKIVFTLSFIMMVVAGFGQVTNVKTGLWSDPTVWSNNILPTDTSNIFLSFNITVDINGACKSINTNGHNVIINSGVGINVTGSNKGPVSAST
jgi:hypothetical protein